MILTGIAKEKFLEWNENREGKTLTLKELELMSESVILNALIIEFFDEYGIHINIFYKYTWRVEIRDSQSSLLSTLNYAVFDTRQEATIQAIKKANDIYNERNEL
ncbi:hypothetical protein IF125_08630 [Empedobacter stercoris]|uniref:hypothetical protein n=1 Tax=Empedobacter stercoris TaxID=1628248 RepID=UPI001CE135E2|nr:hypothetical protein [Empedobacter stercoris]MCA4782330.1 hypothetical protein [Empedobacter stercoris]